MRKDSFWYRFFDLYYDGFCHMTLGKTLWALFIMFAILRVFFFPNFLKENTIKGNEANFIEKELIKRQ